MSQREPDALASVAPWPVLEIVLNADGTGSVNGRSVVAANIQAAQDELLNEATRYAGVLGRPLRVRALDPNGIWHLVAHPDGSVTALPPDDVVDLRSAPDPSGEYDETDRYLAPEPRVEHLEELDQDDEPDDDWPGTMHLRVHPSGAITPVDTEDGFEVRPTRPAADPVRSTPAPEPSPFAGPPFAGSPFATPAASSPRAEPVAVPTPSAVPTEGQPAASAVPVKPVEATKPVESAEPAEPAKPTEPVEPVIVDPVIVDPVIVDPVVVDPVVVDPVPAEPTPAEPAAVEPGSAEPGSVASAAAELAPPDSSVPPSALLPPEPEPEPTPAPDQTEPASASVPDPPGPASAASAPPVSPRPGARTRDGLRPGAWSQFHSPRRPSPPPPARPTSSDPPDPSRSWTATPTPAPSTPVSSTPTSPAPASSAAASSTPAPPAPTSSAPTSSAPAPPDERRPWATPRGGADRDRDHPSDLIEDIRAANPPGPRFGGGRNWVRPAAVAGAGIALVGLVSLVVTDRGGSSAKTLPAAMTPTITQTTRVTSGVSSTPSGGTVPATSRAAASPPAKLNVAPPPGFGTKPVWGVPVSAAAAPLVSADGRIFALTADNQIAMIDPASGSVLWHAPAPANATGPHLVTIDGRPQVAVATPDALIYWGLPDKPIAPQGPPAPTQVTLPAGSSVSWSGPSPLVVQADGSFAVLRNGNVQKVALPTGMRALTADGADVLAASGRNWLRQGAGQAPATPKQLAVPAGATGGVPVRVDNIGGSFLAGMWDGPEGPIAAVYDARNGEMVVQTTFPKGTNFAHAVTVREAGSDRTAVGTALLDPAKQNLSILNPSFTPVALTPGHVYANESSGVVVDLQIKGSDIKVVSFQGKNPAIPVGITTVNSRPYAVVVAPSGSGWLLCALPTS